jgi:hypothetical protein
VLAKGDKITVYRVTDPSRSARAGEQWRNTPRARRNKPVEKQSGPVTQPTQIE